MLDYNNMFGRGRYGNESGEGSEVPDTDCPSGYRRVPTTDGWDCIPSGGSYENKDQNTNCPQGQIWSTRSGVNGPEPRCVYTDCPQGQFRTGDGRCLDNCPGNQYRDPNTGQCVGMPSGGNNNNTQGISSSGQGASLPTMTNPYDKQEKDLYDQYVKMYMGGGDVKDPYDAAAIARLEGKLKGSGEAAKAANKQAYLASRSAMGLGNTGKTGQGIRNINNDVNQRIDEGMIGINDTAIRANYDNQVANVNRKLQILESQSQFAIALAGNAIERQKVQYNYAIQKMQLTQQLESLKLQLMAQLGG